MHFLKNLLQCACPPGAALSSPPVDDCMERFGQWQKIMVQRTKDSGVVNEYIIASTNPNVQATWDTSLAASDSTKIIISPFVSNPANEAGEFRKRGGGNASVGGAETILGNSHSPFTMEFHDIKQAIIAIWKEYQCEKELSIFAINEHGQIGGITDDPATPLIFKGITLSPSTFGISDKKFGMYEEVDMNMIEFSFPPEWSDNFHIITPVAGFDPLVDLINQ